ncbi:hypothetical protein F4561_003602 [Lipingzhangella halophila]|uniref:Uncharacterized protein n=1 Tax=Lipingzhangella halophila TaxID=1783352 RepID=A0A7W7RJ23_9ACTN|nr:hypothetical protein [Lipingzhangella halophila]
MGAGRGCWERVGEIPVSHSSDELVGMSDSNTSDGDGGISTASTQERARGGLHVGGEESDAVPMLDPGGVPPIHAEAWHWTLEQRRGDGSLPTGGEIAAAFGRKQRWGGSSSSEVSRAHLITRPRECGLSRDRRRDCVRAACAVRTQTKDDAERVGKNGVVGLALGPRTLPWGMVLDCALLIREPSPRPWGSGVPRGRDAGHGSMAVLGAVGAHQIGGAFRDGEHSDHGVG